MARHPQGGAIDARRPRVHRVFLLLVLLAATALAPPAAARGGTPLSVDATYNAVPTPDLACGGMHVVGTGTASGVPVGPSLWADDECANLLVAPGSITITGTLVITTRSGDQLRASYRATSALPELDGTIRPAGTFQVIGGTGRFANASGSGWIAATANVFHPATTAHMEGMISAA